LSVTVRVCAGAWYDSLELQPSGGLRHRYWGNGSGPFERREKYTLRYQPY